MNNKNRKYIKIIFLFVLILNIIFISSCKRTRIPEKIDTIQLKMTQPPKELSLWGVTKYSDLKLREELTDESSVLRYLTQGSLVEIIKRNDSITLFDGKRDYWYYVKSDSLTGWIFGAYIDIFNDIISAERKCEQILFNTYEKPLE